MNLIKLNIQEVEERKQFGLMKGEPVKIQMREGAVSLPQSPNTSYSKSEARVKTDGECCYY